MTQSSAFNSNDELLAGYVLGNLTPEEQVKVEQQLAQDPALVAEVQQLQATLALLSLAAPVADHPPASLRDRLLQTASETPQTQAHRGGLSGRLTPRIAWGLTRGIAALVVVGLGISNFQLHRQMLALQGELSHYQEAIALLQQPENRLLSLQSVSDRQSPTGSLLMAPHEDAAVLTLQNLEPLSEGMIYRMWAFVDGEKMDCAEFTPDASGQVFIRLPMQKWSSTTTVIITLEAEQPTTTIDPEMVLMGESL